MHPNLSIQLATLGSRDCRNDKFTIACARLNPLTKEIETVILQKGLNLLDGIKMMCSMYELDPPMDQGCYVLEKEWDHESCFVDDFNVLKTEKPTQ